MEQASVQGYVREYQEGVGMVQQTFLTMNHLEHTAVTSLVNIYNNAAAHPGKQQTNTGIKLGSWNQENRS